MSQSTRPDVRVAVARQGSDVVLTVVGEIDLATVADLSNRLARLTDGDGRGSERVVVDLSGVGFMGASGLSALVTAERALRRRGSTLQVRSPQRVVAHLFELTGLAHFLERPGLDSDHDGTAAGADGDGAASDGRRRVGEQRVLPAAGYRRRS